MTTGEYFGPKGRYKDFSILSVACIYILEIVYSIENYKQTWNKTWKFIIIIHNKNLSMFSFLIWIFYRKVYECGSSISATAGTDILEFCVGWSVIFREFQRHLGNNTLVSAMDQRIMLKWTIKTWDGNV